MPIYRIVFDWCTFEGHIGKLLVGERSMKRGIWPLDANFTAISFNVPLSVHPSMADGMMMALLGAIHPGKRMPIAPSISTIYICVYI